MMARGFGWRQSAYPRVVFNGGPQARSRRKRCEYIRRNSSSRPAILTRKRHRHGVPWIPEKRFSRIKKHLRSVFDSGTLTADGFGMEISRAGGYSRRCYSDSPVNRRESQCQPAQTLREALRGLAVETG